jgi:IS1 family transposase
VDNKGNKQWVWLALDADTREIVGVYIGARDEASAQGLWDSLPAVYRQCAIAYTDFWAAYAAVLPSKIVGQQPEFMVGEQATNIVARSG